MALVYDLSHFRSEIIGVILINISILFSSLTLSLSLPLPLSLINNMEPNNFQRRRSSIFPQYLRKKSHRKDSTFASESTTNLWPISIDEKQPDLYDYQTQPQIDTSFKFGWINGVYVSLA